MPRTDKRRCRTCLYWLWYAWEEGHCKRSAPKSGSCWPLMLETDGCGDHFYDGDQKPALDKRGLPYGAFRDSHPEPESWAPPEGVLAMLAPAAPYSYSAFEGRCRWLPGVKPTGNDPEPAA